MYILQSVIINIIITHSIITIPALYRKCPRQSSLTQQNRARILRCPADGLLPGALVPFPLPRCAGYDNLAPLNCSRQSRNLAAGDEPSLMGSTGSNQRRGVPNGGAILDDIPL